MKVVAVVAEVRSFVGSSSSSDVASGSLQEERRSGDFDASRKDLNKYHSLEKLLYKTGGPLKILGHFGPFRKPHIITDKS